jgi:hypothetical protein
MYAKTTQSRSGSGNIGDTMKTFHQPWNYLAVFSLPDTGTSHFKDLMHHCLTGRKDQDPKKPTIGQCPL